MAIDTGDTAFMFVCTGLVQFMTPGLAFFYGGLVRSTNILTIMLQNFASMGFVFILWWAVLFSMSFGTTLNGILGDPQSYYLFNNVPMTHQLSTAFPDIPGVLFAGYQGMFAVITPALMTGAFADRVKIVPYVLFVTLWMFLIYAPVCHWVWGGGWMQKWGVWDFAGGIVVHITSGFSALASLMVIGPRSKPADDPEALSQPHNVPFVALGTAMLWFGWFGFNGGSALASNSVAVMAMMNSQLAGSMGLVGWIIMDMANGKKPGLVGACVGAVAGLATVTPAAGYITMGGAFVIGFTASIICYFCVMTIQKAELDDALDVWGVHGMGGFTGTLLVGVLADRTVNPGTVERSFHQFYVQASCACICAAYSFIVSYILLKFLDVTVGIRPKRSHEGDLDMTQTGEQAYVTHRSSENLIEDGAASDDDSDTTTEDFEPATVKKGKVTPRRPMDSTRELRTA